MAFRIKNISHQVLLVSLNSGKTVYLAPGESSRPIEELEISGNEKVAELLKANLVATTKVATAKKPKRRGTRMTGSD